MKKKWPAALAAPLFLLLLAALLLNAAETADAAFRAMTLSAKVVVPSLFPFCVFSAFLVQSGLAASWGWKLRRPMALLFHADGACAAPFLLGMLCGYPVGAAAIARLYEKDALSKDSAERALAFSSNASPGFLVAVAGGALLGSGTAGLLLLLTQLLSAFLTGILMRGPMPPQKNEEAPPVGSMTAAFTGSVRSAALTMVQVTGFIVLFSVLLCLLQPVLNLLSPMLRAVFAGILEITNGLSLCSAAPGSLRLKFLLFSALLGWSGLCVHAQVLSFTLPVGLSPGPYLRGKAVQSLLALALSLPLSRLLEEKAVIALPGAASFPTFLLTAGWALLGAGFFFVFLWYFHGKFGIMKKDQAGGE